MSEVQSIGSGNVRAAIARAATRSGVDFGYLMAQARIESSLDPGARAGTSSAAGLYQFTQGTWLRTLEAHGAEHGLDWASSAIQGGRLRDPAMRSAVMALRHDPDASAAMAAELAQDNAAALTPILGRAPDAAELYLAHYRILLGGVPLGGASIRADAVLAIDTGDALPGHGIAGEATRDPSFGCEALWIDPAQRDSAIAQGFLTVDASTVIATQLNQLLAARPQDLLGPDEVRAILEGVKERAAGLVETVHPQPLSLAALTRLLRALLEDGIPVGHPLPILASLSQAVQSTLEHDRLVELLRADLGSLIVGRICAPTERLPVITLDAALEGMIVQGLHDPATGQPVIEPDLARSIGERIATIIAARGPAAPPIALIVQPRARRALAALLRLRAPSCLVLSISELPQAQPIEVIEVVGGEPQPSPALPAPDNFPTESIAA